VPHIFFFDLPTFEKAFILFILNLDSLTPVSSLCCIAPESKHFQHGFHSTIFFLKKRTVSITTARIKNLEKTLINSTNECNSQIISTQFLGVEGIAIFLSHHQVKSDEATSQLFRDGTQQDPPDLSFSRSESHPSNNHNHPRQDF